MHIQATHFSTQEIFPSRVVTGMVTRSFYYRGHSWHELTQKTTAHPPLWPCFPPMEDRKSFQVLPPIPLFLIQEPRKQLGKSATCLGVSPPWGGSPPSSAFHSGLPPAFFLFFFSGPDLDKLAVSFLRALWRTERYTLESLKPCHFHLEPVADLARQPGK